MRDGYEERLKAAAAIFGLIDLLNEQARRNAGSES